MSVARALSQWLGAARRRRFAAIALTALPLALALAIGAWRVDGASAAAWASGLALIAILPWAAWRARQLDARWLARQLNRVRRDMEDSAELLFDDATYGAPTAAAGSHLTTLQRQRLRERLLALATPELRPPWPRRQLAIAWATALGLAGVALLWPTPIHRVAAPTPPHSAPTAPTRTRILAATLHVVAPAYTGLPARDEAALEARVPEGAVVSWSLRLQPNPDSAALRFHDGSVVPLQQVGELWQGQREVREGLLYRFNLGAAPALENERLYRLDVLPDRPPELRVSAPERTLSLLDPGQRDWLLRFEASDDYGLGAAQLHITLAQGSGENVRFSERRLRLTGKGTATRRTFEHRIDLGAMGFAVGDDLVARLSITDNRQPSANLTRHPSFILRWPAPAGAEAAGLEGMVQRTLPAYFRSQRQIIIDSEALIAERARLSEPRFVDRADAIGVDQRILRLRYGQFLGEESEGPRAPGAASESDDEHGHGDASANEAADVLAEFGHTHDQAEATTLFDARTRALLKGALDAMWQSEGLLRQGQPQAALPHQYRALALIKQVQQASRIYLSRVGLELPPIDLSRRLRGDRSGLRDRADPLAAAVPTNPAVVAAWAATDAGAAQPLDVTTLDALADWAQAQGARLPDRLALLAAIDPLRRDPACARCVTELRRLLWPLLPTPPANVRWRAAPSAGGGAYLDAIATPPAEDTP
ncbi:MAG: DUF4175 family protein [Xanthomonadaceae bacterium]|nr:DUF4175 family protein [Xanthomonadaceae bacterium]